MQEMYFICPVIFFILAIVFPISINEKIPQIVDVDIYQIHSDDIRKMSSENRKYLRTSVTLWFSVAFILTLVISVVFYVFFNTTSLLSLTICNGVSLSVGLATALLPLKKVASQLKSK